MSSRKPGATPPADAASVPAVDLLPEDDAEQLDALLTELPGETYVRASKLIRAADGRTEQWQRIGKYAIQGFDADAIAQRNGGGTFRFWFIGPDKRLLTTRTDTWIETPVAPAATPGAPAAAPAGADSYLREFLTLTLNQMQAAQANAQALTLGVLQSLTNGGGGLKASDILEAVKLGREQSGAQPAAAPAGGLDSLRDAVELVRELQGAGGDGERTGGGDTLSLIGGKLLDVLAARVAAPAPAPMAAPVRPGLPALPVGRPTVAPAAPVAVAGNGGGPLTLYLKEILAEAQAGRDGYVFGQYLIERVPPDVSAYLATLAASSQERRAELLAEYAPELMPHLLFVNDAFQGIREYFEDPPEEAGDGATDAVDTDPASAG